MSDATYEKLMAFRGSSDLTEDQVIVELLELVKDIDDERVSEETLQKIEKAREDLKAGRTYSMEEVMEELGDHFE